MSKRYSGKSFKDSSTMKKPKLSLKEKRKLKKEKAKKSYLIPISSIFFKLKRLGPASIFKYLLAFFKIKLFSFTLC